MEGVARELVPTSPIHVSQVSGQINKKTTSRARRRVELHALCCPMLSSDSVTPAPINTSTGLVATLKWSKPQEKILIDLVRENPELWDKSDDNTVTSSVDKGIIWDTICTELNIKIKDKEKVRNKLKTLVTNYKKESLKKNMPCRPGQPPPKPFQWQEKMSFLDNNLFADSCSNMAEEEVKTTRHSSPPSSVKENLSPSRELQVTAKDLSATESEWNFLKSLLFDMNMIAGNQEKQKFRLDAMCLLYNYCLTDPQNDNESGTGASFDDYNDPPLPNNPSIGESSLFNFNRNPFNSSLQDPEKKFKRRRRRIIRRRRMVQKHAGVDNAK
ncbi:unnamed protein product [Trichogramma brassicae]|uniref:MADF domain-containing protein n=1 Tax=Trichogramma brassicae TaxID=86971 RepID=A0A6H5I9U7_9HYME|nr:unnamed protein product [Trichogramma brassicae]